MATTPKRFVASGQVTRDLLNSIQADTDPDLAIVRELLSRASNCDFKAELIAGLSQDGGTTLAQVIHTYIRNNSGDTTALKAAERLYLNPQSLPLKQSQHAYKRVTPQLTQALQIAYQRDIVQNLATLDKCYSRVGNVLTFTRPARIMLVASLNWGVWDGDGNWDSAPASPSWRFSAGGNNRVITAGLNVLIEGSLTQGVLARKLQPQAAIFYEEEIYPSTLRPMYSTMVLDVLTPQSSFGRIEKLSLEVERSPFVISYGTQVDNLGFFKTTVADSEDNSNFIEVIEL